MIYDVHGISFLRIMIIQARERQDTVLEQYLDDKKTIKESREVLRNMKRIKYLEEQQRKYEEARKKDIEIRSQIYEAYEGVDKKLALERSKGEKLRKTIALNEEIKITYTRDYDGCGTKMKKWEGCPCKKAWYCCHIGIKGTSKNAHLRNTWESDWCVTCGTATNVIF
jgi:hypothetical protein